MSDRPNRLSAVGLSYIFITLVCWSSVPLFLKYFTKHIDAWTANGWRYGMSALVWAPVLAIAAWKGKLPKAVWMAAIVPAVANLSGQICFAFAPYFINPGLQTFLLRTQIVFIAIGSYLIFPTERPLLRTPLFWIGLVTVVAGGVGIVLLNPAAAQTKSTRIGIVLALAGGIGFGAYSLAVRYYMNRFHPVLAFGVISNYTAAALVSLMLLRGQRHGMGVDVLSARQFVLLVVSAMVGIAFSHGLYYAALNRIGVSMSSGVIQLQPVIVSLGSFFLFDERLTMWQWVSGTAAIAGATIMVAAQHLLTTKRDRGGEASQSPGVLPNVAESSA